MTVALIRTSALVRLLRPPDSAIALVGTFVGARLAGLEWSSLSVVGAVAASNTLLLSASMAFNDWHDVAEDAINRPRAPIPSGSLARGLALGLGCGLFAVGIAIALLAQGGFFALACAFTALSVAYTLRLKRTGLAGNVLVAVLSSQPLWCWMLVARPVSATYATLCVGCILLCLGREILRSAEDWPGDSVSGVTTLATARGVAFANRAGAAVVWAAFLVAWLPVVTGTADALYAALLILSGAVFGGTWAWTQGGRGGAGRLSRRLVSAARVATVIMAVAYAFGVLPSGR